MYDLIIVGGGPAGFTCAIYASRYKLKTLLISEIFGGQIIESPDVENYPGIKKVSGYELMKTMQEQAKTFGTEIVNERVEQIVKKDGFMVNGKYESKSIVLALGMKRRKLEAKNEGQFSGRGVSYCATCDGAFFHDKIVGVIGGNDSAAESALLLAEYAKKVYIIYRKDKLRAEPINVERISKNKKIELITNTNIIEFYGEKVLKGVIFDNGKKFELDGVFIEIGWLPQTELPKMLKVGLKDDLVKVNDDMSTNVKGVFACGDNTIGCDRFNQIVTAVAEGAIAARSAYKFISS